MDDLKINYTSGAKKELETLIDDIGVSPTFCTKVTLR